jgi:hypothetical protein
MRLTRKITRTALGASLGLGLFLSLLVSACPSRQHLTGGVGFSAGLEKRQNPGLELRAFLTADTITSGSPIEVVYFVINGPTPTPFLNNPDIIAVIVELDDGGMAPVRSGYAVLGSWGSMVEMTLPAYGVLGQREDLRCIQNAGYAPRGPQGGDCEIEYDLDTPGVYRVIVRYSPPRVGRYAHQPIADTATLVVR